MTEYRFHWLLARITGTMLPTVSLEAESRLHGAALALREFRQHGCDLAAPLAHLDVTAPSGAHETLLVGEVLDWLNDPAQVEFVRREGLAILNS